MNSVTNLYVYPGADIEYNTNEQIDKHENYILTLKVIIIIALLYFSVLIGLLRWLCNAYEEPHPIITQ